VTIVREYRAEDKQRLRMLAMQNYATLVSESQSAESPADGSEIYFEHILQMQLDGKGFIYVAEENGSLSGFVCLLAPVNPVEGGSNEAPYGFMSDLFVVPERRRQGIATLLNAQVEKQMRALGITQLALRVAANNVTARDFYRREDYCEQFVVMSKQIRP
jgi:ribosomal protein S18 acetylase RimI-like enzyme